MKPYKLFRFGVAFLMLGCSHGNVMRRVDLDYFIVKNVAVCPLCGDTSKNRSRCMPQWNADYDHEWWILSEHLVTIIQPRGCGDNKLPLPVRPKNSIPLQ